MSCPFIICNNEMSTLPLASFYLCYHIHSNLNFPLLLAYIKKVETETRKKICIWQFLVLNLIINPLSTFLSILHIGLTTFSLHLMSEARLFWQPWFRTHAFVNKVYLKFCIGVFNRTLSIYLLELFVL